MGRGGVGEEELWSDTLSSVTDQEKQISAFGADVFGVLR